ncbi:MAG: EAL domain-containing protein [Lachnospiraceae bacterium]|nr:EAL domain-containing protein [Lachnospiraceae bacterium]
MGKKDVILIIDDSRLNRKALIDILAGEYEILQAANGKEGLEILDREGENIAAIILDLIMPIMNGYEFLKEFKAQVKYDNLPVVVTTAADGLEDERKCLKLGVSDFIPKSFDRDIIRFRIMNVIRQSKRQTLEFDPLTKLYNQQKFYMEVETLLKRYSEETFIFMRIDVERFKMINSFYGTKEGDRLICYMADIIHHQMRHVERCVYGRITADIFAVCFPYNMALAEDIANFMEESLKHHKAHYYLEPSIGIYVIEDNSMEISTIYDRVTIAAKESKGSYRCAYTMYTHEMEEQMIREQEIINEMEHALNHSQFTVFYQPQFDAETKKPCGAEALVRWIKPDGSMVSPGDFIPVFEKNGFIIQLDMFVWEMVCKYLRKRLDEGKKVDAVSVNVSRVNLYNPGFVETVTELVQKYRIPVKYFHLEITESAFIDNMVILKKILTELQNRGFTILMDDFGSGYSSLNVLKNIDVDVLKIDMGFLPKSRDDVRSEKILAAVINMAKDLDIPSIAEGVEEKEQYDLLKELGCTVIQGYYFGRPMPEKEYAALCDRS